MLRRRARLEGAQLHLARGNLDEAEQMLRAVIWDTPAEQLSLETGLALLKVHLARQEFALALTRCTSLLPLAESDNARAELLYHFIEINFALAQEKPARDALAKLLKDHPYTEQAARAKDKWHP
jgi:outer membrane protein assembly factor BamD (BamD/ComL family)